MMTTFYRLVALGTFLLCTNKLFAQQGMGLGNNNPQEMLDVTGAIRIASNLNNNPGTIRWTGSDFEGRTVSGWVSLTGGGGTDDQNLTGATFSGNTLTIDIENGNSVSIDLSQFDDDTDADADPTNELLTGASLSGTTLNIIDAGGTQSVDLSALNNSGTDDQNLTSATLSGNILTIGIENGNSVTVDLSQFDDDVDADADPTNEFQNLSSTTSGTNRTINISDGTGTTISVADNDNDSSNELQTLSISGSDITLSNGGGTVSVPNDGDWTISGNNQYSAVSGNLGIGTAAPTQKLHLRVSQNTGQAYPLLIQNTAAQNGGGTGSGIGFTNMGADGIRTAIYNERTADYAKGKLHFLMSNTNTTADVNLATDSRMTITSAGNVGIGQTIPVDKLHVAGAIRMVDGNQQAGYIPVSDANGTMTWTDPTTIAAANDGDWTVSGTNVYRATGNVGIGTTSPASTFQVVTSQTGNVSKLHNPGLANGSLVGHEFGKANSVYNMVEFRYNHVSDGNPSNWVNLGLWGNANTLNVTGGGNVGVGTTSPVQKLEVAGNTRITGLSGGGDRLVYTNNNGDLYAAGGIPAGDNDYVQNQTGTDQVADFRISGQGQLNTLVATANGSWYLRGGDDHELRDVNIANMLGVWGRPNSDRAGIQLGSDGTFIFGDNGHLGVGTATPAEKLHVAGAIRMVDGNQQAGYIPVSDANGTMTWTDPTTIAAANDGDWTVSGTNVYRATGNVGIGTTSPASTFQVVTSQTGNVSKLHNPGLANGSLVGHEFGKANSVYNMVEFRYNHVSDGNPANWVNLGLWGNANTLNVTGGGNIGVGTFAPEQMLHMKKDNGHAIVKVEATSTSHEARIEFHKWAGTKTAEVGFYPGTPDLRMRTNDGEIIFEPFGTERVRIDEFGNVGIGTNNPGRELIVVGQTETDDLFADRIGVGTTNPYQAKLVVLGTGSPISVSYGYLSSSGNTGTISNQNIAYSIYAEGRIRASEYNAVSDERVKVIEQRTNTGKMLDLVNQLTVTEYSYIDTLANGSRTKQGFIAQEIEAVYPNAINKSTDFIPNVFEKGEVTAYDEATQMATISLSKSHGLTTADHIKLITEDGDVMADVADATQTTLTVKLEKQVDEVFVYGKQVDDFRAVDYDQVFSIGIAAIQELSDKVEALEVENAALKAELRTEKTTNEARLQVIEEQLGIGLKAQR